MARELATGHSAVVACVSVLLLLVGGCRTQGAPGVSPSQASRIDIAVESGANQNSALAVDIVFIRSRPALASLSQFAARDYFRHKDTLWQEFEQSMSVQAFALVPGQVIENAAMQRPRHIVGMLVFANYASAGSHRLQLDPSWSGTILLGHDSLVWLPKP